MVDAPSPQQKRPSPNVITHAGLGQPAPAMAPQVSAATKTAAEIEASTEGPVHAAGLRESILVIEDEHDPDDDFQMDPVIKKVNNGRFKRNSLGHDDIASNPSQRFSLRQTRRAVSQKSSRPPPKDAIGGPSRSPTTNVSA
jgi:hypothetical protein